MTSAYARGGAVAVCSDAGLGSGRVVTVSEFHPKTDGFGRPDDALVNEVALTLAVPAARAGRATLRAADGAAATVTVTWPAGEPGSVVTCTAK